MFQTQRNPINKRVSGLWMAGAFLLLSIVGVVRVLSPLPPIPDASAVKEIPNLPPRLGKQPRALSRVRFHSPDLLPLRSEFYRTIIDNNLFRPLGWTPPRPVEPYQLLGTILPTNEKIPPQAIIQISTAGNKTHIVSIGDTLDADTKIVDIQPKQVVLDRAGQQTTLKLDTSPWISTSKGRFSRRR